MSLGVQASYQQRALLMVAFLAAILAAVLLPLSFISRNWIVLDTSTATQHNQDQFTLHSSMTTKIGLIYTCTETPFEKEPKCQWKFPEKIGCNRSGSQMRDRMSASAAFLIIGWIICIPLVVVSAAFVCHGDRVGHKNRDVNCECCHFQGDRKKGAMIRAGLTVAAIIFVLIGLSIFGGTMADWASCGRHYCNDLIAQERARLGAQRVGAGSNITQVADIQCGYGYSFGGGIVSLVSLFGVLIFVLCEYTSAGSAQAAEEADHPKQVFILDSTPREHQAMQPVNQNHQHQQNTGVYGDEDQQEAAGHGGYPANQKQNEVQRTMPVGSQSNHHSQQQRALPDKVEDFREPSKSEYRNEASPASERRPGGNGKPIPEGEDWVWDEANALYWSASQKLYFDEDSGHFYDPESQLWFNPSNGQWYNL